jgi:hypothetical protein
MEDFMKNIWLLGLLAFVGCTGDKGDTADTGDTETDADTDTDTDTDTDADVMDVTTSWDGDGLSITVTNPEATGWDFGMAQTGIGIPDGWYGEDCIAGTVEGSGDFDICHMGMGAAGFTLTGVTDPESVVGGTSTLFNQSLADEITYVLFDANSDACWTWGVTSDYYDAFLCTEMFTTW